MNPYESKGVKPRFCLAIVGSLKKSFWIVLIASTIITTLGYGQAASNSATSNTVVKPAEPPIKAENSWDWLFKSSAFKGFVLGSVALLATGCGLLKRKLDQAPDKFTKQLHSDVHVPSNSKKNSIMVIGIGGSGKTSIRNSICDPGLSGTEEQTSDYTTKRLKFQAEGDGHSFFYYYVSDYKGQDFGTLISAFIKQQLQRYTPMRFGFINSLIFVVDLIDPLQHLDKDGKPIRDKEGKPAHLEFKDFNEDRIKEHLTEWNRTSLDAVFGLQSRESLSYVCLFINKFNFLNDSGVVMRKRILAEYSPLIAELNRRCQFTNEKTKNREYYAQVEVIIGNAQALPASMMGNLKKFSVPHTAKYGDITIDE